MSQRLVALRGDQIGPVLVERLSEPVQRQVPVWTKLDTDRAQLGDPQSALGIRADVQREPAQKRTRPSASRKRAGRPGTARSPAAPPKAAATATALEPEEAVSPAPRSQTRASISSPAQPGHLHVRPLGEPRVRLEQRPDARQVGRIAVDDCVRVADVDGSQPEPLDLLRDADDDRRRGPARPAARRASARRTSRSRPGPSPGRRRFARRASALRCACRSPTSRPASRRGSRSRSRASRRRSPSTSRMPSASPTAARTRSAVSGLSSVTR